MRTRVRDGVSRTLATAAAIIAVGCGGGDGAASDAEDVPVFAVAAPDVRIGAVDDPDYAFGTVTALAEGPDGRLYSLHANEASVRRWTADGLPDGRVGREGEGPGEFQRPGSLGFFGDSLWVVDRRAYRASYFDGQGAFLGAVTPQVRFATREEGPTGSPPRPERPLRDGRWYGRKPAWSEEIVRGDLSRIPHVLMSDEGEVLDTAWVQEYRPSDILGLLNEDGSGGTFGPQPFGDAPLSSLSDDGTLAVVQRRTWNGEGQPTFRVLRLSLEGDTLLDRHVAYRAEPLHAARVDSTVKASAERMHGFMTRIRPGLALGDLERSYADATYVPDYLPAVESLVTGRDGSLWLERFDPADGADEWWVLDRMGARSRIVRLPLGFRLLSAGPDHVWGVETDTLDVSYIVRYRLEPAP